MQILIHFKWHCFPHIWHPCGCMVIMWPATETMCVCVWCWEACVTSCLWSVVHLWRAGGQDRGSWGTTPSVCRASPWCVCHVQWAAPRHALIPHSPGDRGNQIGRSPPLTPPAQSGLRGLWRMEHAEKQREYHGKMWQIPLKQIEPFCFSSAGWFCHDIKGLNSWWRLWIHFWYVLGLIIW